LDRVPENSNSHAGSLEDPNLLRVLQRLCPADDTSRPRAPHFDRHFGACIEALSEELGATAFAVVELDPLDYEFERSYTVYIGRSSAPSWMEFNREMEEPERTRVLRTEAEPLVYWVLRLSRVAPYWAGYWNQFDLKQGRVRPNVAAQPSSWEWASIAGQVRKTLAERGIEELSQPTLDASLPWKPAKDGRPFTVFRCLFSDE
jgi:hypothetical protein